MKLSLHCDFCTVIFLLQTFPASAAWVAVVLSRIRYQAMTNEPLYRLLQKNTKITWIHEHTFIFIAVQYEWLPVDSWAHIRGNHKHQRCHTYNIPHHYQEDYLYLWCSLKNSYAKYLKKVITSQTQEIITQECNIKIQILIFGNKEVVGLFQYL